VQRLQNVNYPYIAAAEYLYAYTYNAFYTQAGLCN